MLITCFSKISFEGSHCGLCRRASAAVETLLEETRVRAGILPTAGSLTGAATKRKRVQAPKEECPYCEHTYTVRDGLSAKTDDDGERYSKSRLASVK